MRKFLLTLLAMLPLASFAAVPKTVTLNVQNMTCELCPITIRKSLLKVSGVSTVAIDYEKKTAVVTFDPDRATTNTLTQATTNAGFPSTLHP